MSTNNQSITDIYPELNKVSECYHEHINDIMYEFCIELNEVQAQKDLKLIIDFFSKQLENDINKSKTRQGVVVW